MSADIKTLRNIPLFKNFSDSDLGQWNKRCGWQEFAANEQIIDRQSDTRDIYFITKGSARVVNYSISGREISFDDIHQGTFFGELSALDGEPRSANVVALTQTEVATLSETAFKDLLINHPETAIILMQRMSKIIRTSVDRIMDLSTLGANNRVYAEILRLARNGRISNNESRIDPVPNHSDIASRVSTTRETVARVFSELSKKQLLEKSKNTLVVRDLSRLQEMVEEFKGD
ncbi:Crp/Fnr family transcriptional regulator [Curvivirga aplysinae]|uniref:Crp/Fnr family transcriptional regulator n=1 Tax=Curvivirga aplysinae TaxID=2529852 RepID=UPI0012BCEE7D|nr:Crp/Fnr family transcriptional regulator [Curvivirga aplysinae]MTI10851.1 Crp/Fnr family transcriptional regulator [Curvivirga aplysinae]